MMKRFEADKNNQGYINLKFKNIFFSVDFMKSNKLKKIDFFPSPL